MIATSTVKIKQLAAINVLDSLFVVRVVEIMVPPLLSTENLFPEQFLSTKASL